jgi:TAG lipase/steryl ester hydrolase/phospholipase A2/LPA acyltransferase
VFRRRSSVTAMRRATSYEEWLEAARRHERETGADRWRADPDSPHYHAELIRQQLATLRRLRAAGDVELLLDHLHESLHRNLGDLEATELYARSPLGTKHLIGEYLEETEQTIEQLVTTDLPGFDPRAKHAILSRALGNFGRSALLLSGGATLGFYHLGVVKALWHAGLLPDVIAGASMGAMVAAGIGSRTDAELDALFATDVPDIRRVGLGLADPRAMWSQRALLDPSILLETIEVNCGHATFEEAHARSGRTLNISVAPTRTRQKPRVLSHLTAPDVLVKSAALASSAVPGLFPPVTLTRRARSGVEEPYIGTERWIDGSFGNDLPMSRIGRLHNVNHFLVSQVNPHVLPFSEANRWSPQGLALRLATRPLRRRVVPMLDVAASVAGTTRLPRSLGLLLSLAQQEVGGDIDIHPRFDLGMYLKVMKNPSEDELRRFVLEGQRATWPKLAMIRDQTRISRCLARSERALR